MTIKWAEAAICAYPAIRQAWDNKTGRAIVTPKDPANTSAATAQLVVRRGRFSFSDATSAHWISDKPELSQMINGASLVMPFLEPFLISSIQAARAKITDPHLDTNAADFCRQETQHSRTHRRFNATLTANGYTKIDLLEVRMRADYAKLQRCPLPDRLAYTAGFEAMTLGLTRWIVNQRQQLFAKADPAMASFILWHMVEEIEHKCVAFDVYQTVSPGYVRRAWGVIVGSLHVIRLSRAGYEILLQHDGLWRSPRSRLKVWWHVLLFIRNVLPSLIRAILPGHDPRHEKDLDWVRDWIEGYDALVARSGEPAEMPTIDGDAPGIPPPFPATHAA